MQRSQVALFVLCASGALAACSGGGVITPAGTGGAANSASNVYRGAAPASNASRDAAPMSVAPAAPGAANPDIASHGQAWATVPLGYTPSLLFSAVFSANDGVWFSDHGTNQIGEISEAGATQLYNAGNFNYVPPGPVPDVESTVRPTDVEAGPSGTTYYLGGDGYGVMSSSGSYSLYGVTFALGNTVQTLLGPPASTTMAVSADGSAWMGALDDFGTGSAFPVVVRSLGSSLTLITVGAHPQAPPGWLTIGPDGNVWFSSGQTIGTINAATNALTTFAIPSNLTTTNGFAADIVADPAGGVWVSYCNATETLLHVAKNGVMKGHAIPAGGGCFQGSHQLVNGPDDALYLAGGGYNITRFETTNNQFSTYNILPKPSGVGGVQTAAVNNGQIWVFESNNSNAQVFFPSHVISAKPASLTIAKGNTAKVTVTEGLYTGTFSASSSAGCASVTSQGPSGVFTVTANYVTSTPCYVSISDTAGLGTVYVKVAVTPA